MLAPRVTSVAITAQCLCLLFASAGSAAESFDARLSTMPIDEVNRGIVAGSGAVRAVLDGNKLSLTGSFTGLRGPATVARVHQSRGDRGIRGSAIYELSVTQDVAGSIEGEAELTPEQVEMLLAGRLYVQIHSTSAPDGNLWGWLIK
jgi:hypothetical protein